MRRDVLLRTSKVTSVAGARLCPTRPRSDRGFLKRVDISTVIDFPFTSLQQGRRIAQEEAIQCSIQPRIFMSLVALMGFSKTAVRQFSIAAIQAPMPAISSCAEAPVLG